MKKVKSVGIKEGVKFKLKSGDVYTVKAHHGKSQSGKSDLWLCLSERSGHAIFTDWSILDKQLIE